MSTAGCPGGSLHNSLKIWKQSRGVNMGRSDPLGWSRVYDHYRNGFYDLCDAPRTGPEGNDLAKQNYSTWHVIHSARGGGIFGGPGAIRRFPSSPGSPGKVLSRRSQQKRFATCSIQGIPTPRSSFTILHQEGTRSPRNDDIGKMIIGANPRETTCQSTPHR